MEVMCSSSAFLLFMYMIFRYHEQEKIVRNRMSIKIELSFLFLLTIFLFGCGTTVHAINPGGDSPDKKTAVTSPPPATGGGVTMRVLWTVSEFKVAANAAWGKEEGRRLLFKPLDMDANSITFDDKSCRDVIFNKETVKTKEYLDNSFQISPLSLGIRDEAVEIIKTNCDLPGFAEFMRLTDRRLVIHINGVFFFFKPAVTY
jgi:hypothetical protein